MTIIFVMLLALTAAIGAASNPEGRPKISTNADGDLSLSVSGANLVLKSTCAANTGTGTDSGLNATEVTTGESEYIPAGFLREALDESLKLRLDGLATLDAVAAAVTAAESRLQRTVDNARNVGFLVRSVNLASCKQELRIKRCPSAAAAGAEFVTEGLLANSDLYTCIVTFDNLEFEAPAAVANVGQGGQNLQKVTCTLPAVVHTTTSEWEATLYIRENGALDIPSAIPLIVTYYNQGPILPEAGRHHTIATVGEGSDLLADGLSFTLDLGYFDYFDDFVQDDGTLIGAEYTEITRNVLNPVGGFTPNLAEKQVTLKMLQSFKALFLFDSTAYPDPTFTFEFEVKLTDTHNVSLSTVVTVELGKLPQCIYDCKGLTGFGVSSTVYAKCGGGELFCNMEIDGGGWTLVANINPADGNNVEFRNRDFWARPNEYRSFSNCLSSDYKSTMAGTLAGGELMIQTAPRGAGQENTKTIGWRKWQFSQTWNSMFQDSDTGAGNGQSCATGPATGGDVGTSSSWDQIIRRGNCLYSDLNFGGSVDLIRLTTQFESSDNQMNGFGTCIDCCCGHNGGGQNYAGMDFAACEGSCHYHTNKRLSGGTSFGSYSNGGKNDGKHYDCIGTYCDGNYAHAWGSGNKRYIKGWNYRFFIR